MSKFSWKYTLHRVHTDLCAQVPSKQTQFLPKKTGTDTKSGLEQVNGYGVYLSDAAYRTRSQARPISGCHCF